jgi:hypothetical protein
LRALVRPGEVGERRRSLTHQKPRADGVRISLEERIQCASRSSRPPF